MRQLVHQLLFCSWRGCRLMLFLFLMGLVFGLAAAEMEPGAHLQQPCDGAPQLTYNVYLPKAYADKSAERFAVLFISEASAPPTFQSLEAWAERQEVVIVTINDSRNGPWEPIIAAQKAVTATVFAKLRLHHCLRFSMGHSGAGWASGILAMNFGDDWGGVLFGGIPNNTVELRKAWCAGYLGGVKDETISINSIRASAAAARALGCPTRIREFAELGHAWAPIEERIAMLDWMLDWQRLSHPRLTPDELKAGFARLRVRMEALKAEADPAARVAGAETLLQIDNVAKSKDGAALKAIWCSAQVTLADAETDPVLRNRRYEEVMTSDRIAMLPAPERKALQTKIANLRKRNVVRADSDSRAALADARRAETNAGSTKGALKDALNTYLALAKRWPDTEASKDAATAAEALMGKLTQP